MKKLIYSLSLVLLGSASAFAQTNLCAGEGVSVHTLGDAKTWYPSTGDVTYTFNPDEFKYLLDTSNTSQNILLFPQAPGGASYTYETEANKSIGIQGFYIDLGSSQSIGTVVTTWEGATAKNYEIFVTDDVPTLDILNEEPTFIGTDVGQLTNTPVTASLPSETKGRYIVFQGTEALNWGWGVKIRTFAAYAPAEDVLTSFTVSPEIVILGTATPLTLSMKNQFGEEISPDLVEIDIDGDYDYEDGNLIINSGNFTNFTAKMNGVEKTVTIWAATAPELPKASAIKTPIYTNTETGNNSTAEFTVAYNGGATKGGELTFENGEVAQLFSNARCIFFSNSETTGAWNGDIYPVEKGYKNLCLDVFSSRTVDCTIEFESVENLAGGTTYTYSLTAGEWTYIKVDVEGAAKLGNLSIRFSQENIDDILLANIYFSPANNYFLYGTMTVDGEGNSINYNPSFQFEDNGDGSFTLNVASVKQGDTFVITDAANDVELGSNFDQNGIDLLPVDMPLTAGGSKIAFNASYANLTFTLNVDETNYYLAITGTPTTDGLYLTPGNDKTNQSGVVSSSSEDGLDGDIVMQTMNDYALVFVYSNTQVYYDYVVNTTKESIKAFAADNYTWTAAEESAKDGAYIVKLPNETTGTLYIATSEDATSPAQTYAFEIQRSVPTGIESAEVENVVVDIYTLSGVTVAKGVNFNEVKSALTPGLYIVGGKKVIVK